MVRRARTRPSFARSLTTAALALAAMTVGCAPVGPTPLRPLAPHDPSPCAGSDAGPTDARLRLDASSDLADASVLGDDARMASHDPFSIEPDAPRVTVHAAERAFVGVTLRRAPEHTAFVEVKASGLPAGVAGIVAIGPGPGELGLVIEAADTARAITDTPFTLEAHADGVRVSRRLLLTVLPERPIPEE